MRNCLRLKPSRSTKSDARHRTKGEWHASGAIKLQVLPGHAHDIQLDFDEMKGPAELCKCASAALMLPPGEKLPNLVQFDNADVQNGHKTMKVKLWARDELDNDLASVLDGNVPAELVRSLALTVGDALNVF